MAKVKVLGDAAVITSEIDHEVLASLKKYKPQQLKLVDPETKDELFAVSLGNTASVSKYGVVFTSKDPDGKAALTIQLPANLDGLQKTQYIKDNYGFALLSLNKIEAAIQGAAQELINEFEQMDNAIEIIG